MREVDLVHHGGESPAGEYGYTLQLIDVATGWSERAALLGRGQRARQRAFEQVLGRLPFAEVELPPDTGSAIFFDHLVAFWTELVVVVQISRSRPYQKDDNRLVEQ